MADEKGSVDTLDAVVDLLSTKPAAKPGTDDPPADSLEAGTLPLTDDQAAPGPEPGDDEGDFDFTPAAIAEKLGVKPDELFANLKIPVDGGDALTLEEFKESGQGLRELRSAQNELAEQRVTFENETMLQRQTLQAALSKLPADAVSPEVITWLSDQHQSYVATERRALNAVRPDLADSKKWNGVRDLLIAHLGPYGFRDIEVDAIVDHRLAKYVIDNAEREQRVGELAETAEKGVKPLQKPAARPAPKGRPRRTETKRRTGPKIAPEGRRTRAETVSAVADLLGE